MISERRLQRIVERVVGVSNRSNKEDSMTTMTTDVAVAPDWDTVLVQVTMAASVTIAYVEFAGHTAVGEAKRMPADDHNDDVAVCLAVGRALEILAESLTRYGMARSHTLTRT